MKPPAPHLSRDRIRSDTQHLIAHYVPSGIIVMWSGAIASVPNGWRICDGTNGTPDLRDRFIIGAGNTYAVDASGGTTSHNHTGATGTGNANVHRDTEGTGDNAQGLNHTHSISTATMLPPYYALAYIMKG